MTSPNSDKFTILIIRNVSEILKLGKILNEHYMTFQCYWMGFKNIPEFRKLNFFASKNLRIARNFRIRYIFWIPGNFRFSGAHRTIMCKKHVEFPNIWNLSRFWNLLFFIFEKVMHLWIFTSINFKNKNMMNVAKFWTTVRSKAQGCVVCRISKFLKIIQILRTLCFLLRKVGVYI